MLRTRCIANAARVPARHPTAPAPCAHLNQRYRGAAPVATRSSRELSAQQRVGEYRRLQSARARSRERTRGVHNTAACRRHHRRERWHHNRQRGCSCCSCCPSAASEGRRQGIPRNSFIPFVGWASTQVPCFIITIHLTSPPYWHWSLDRSHRVRVWRCIPCAFPSAPAACMRRHTAQHDQTYRPHEGFSLPPHRLLYFPLPR